MLIQPHDGGTADEWRAFVTANSFGQLVAAGRGRDIAVVVPTQFVLAGDEVLLHLARANPVWAAIEENPSVVLSVAGDWAYIPSSWKTTGAEDPAMGIPTTYYAAVQLVGRADPSVHRRRLGAIRGLRIDVHEVRAKFKYGGNVDTEHRRAVADRLALRDGPGDAVARRHLIRRLQDEPPTGGVRNVGHHVVRCRGRR